MRTGFLGWIVSTPELHRWHHSEIPSESNANYGATLIVWDVVFGTRRRPLERPHAKVLGVSEPKGFPTTFAAQLASPFAPRLWR
jgi:sterol desaturase/sphingolipid hydroxylase (fatty acid hydroxylase superfamily)